MERGHKILEQEFYGCYMLQELLVAHFSWQTKSLQHHSALLESEKTSRTETLGHMSNHVIVILPQLIWQFFHYVTLGQ